MKVKINAPEQKAKKIKRHQTPYYRRFVKTRKRKLQG